jgi:hypothetical protein
MFIVASASFRLLYVVIILAHDRRKIMRTDVTEHPTAAWISRQVIDAFPWDTAPRYLLRDRDASYGSLSLLQTWSGLDSFANADGVSNSLRVR